MQNKILYTTLLLLTTTPAVADKNYLAIEKCNIGDKNHSNNYAKNFDTRSFNPEIIFANKKCLKYLFKIMDKNTINYIIDALGEKISIDLINNKKLEDISIKIFEGDYFVSIKNLEESEILLNAFKNKISTIHNIGEQTKKDLIKEAGSRIISAVTTNLNDEEIEKAFGFIPHSKTKILKYIDKNNYKKIKKYIKIKNIPNIKNNKIPCTEEGMLSLKSKHLEEEINYDEISFNCRFNFQEKIELLRSMKLIDNKCNIYTQINFYKNRKLNKNYSCTNIIKKIPSLDFITHKEYYQYLNSRKNLILKNKITKEKDKEILQSIPISTEIMRKLKSG